jgi:uncharacterized protein with HEPN domain
MSRDHQSLQDIVNAAQEILSFTTGLDKTALAGDRRTQAAVLYEIVVIGEATKRLSTEFRSQYPTIPWRNIAGMRDIVAHQYDRVDPEVVWDVVHIEIPGLIAMLQPLLSPEVEE